MSCPARCAYGPVCPQPVSRVYTRRGFRASRSSGPRPRRSMAPGRLPSSSTSTWQAMRATTSGASAWRRSTATVCLPRRRKAAGSGPRRSGRRTSVTSAPKSARIIEQKGPGPRALRSSTRMPASGPSLIGSGDRGAAVLLAEKHLGHLARDVARQLVDDAHLLGVLVAGQAPGDGLVDGVRTDVRAWRRYDEGPADRAPFRIGNADDRHLGDVGVLQQEALDLGRVHVLAARLVHVLHAVDEVVEAFVVAAGHVAGAEPAVGEVLGVVLAPVAGGDARALDPDLPRLAGGGVAAVIVDEAHGCVLHGPADRARVHVGAVDR